MLRLPLVQILFAHIICRHLKGAWRGAVCLFFRPSSSSVSIKRFSRLWSAPISNSGVFIPDWPDSPHLALLCLSSQTDCWEEVGHEGGWGVSTLHVDCWRLFAAWTPSHAWKIVFQSKKTLAGFHADRLFCVGKKKTCFVLLYGLRHLKVDLRAAQWNVLNILASFSRHSHASSCDFVNNLMCEVGYKVGDVGIPESWNTGKF